MSFLFKFTLQAIYLLLATLFFFTNTLILFVFKGVFKSGTNLYLVLAYKYSYIKCIFIFTTVFWKISLLVLLLSLGDWRPFEPLQGSFILFNFLDCPYTSASWATSTFYVYNTKVWLNYKLQQLTYNCSNTLQYSTVIY